MQEKLQIKLLTIEQKFDPKKVYKDEPNPTKI